MKLILITSIAIFFAILLYGCTLPPTTSFPSATLASTVTAKAIPTQTSTSTPTLTPTQTSTSTPTSTPTQTPTLVPTPVGGADTVLISAGTWYEKSGGRYLLGHEYESLFEFALTKKSLEKLFDLAFIGYDIVGIPEIPSSIIAAAKLNPQSIANAIGRDMVFETETMKVSPDGKNVLVELCYDRNQYGMCGQFRVYLISTDLQNVSSLESGDWKWSPSGKSMILESVRVGDGAAFASYVLEIDNPPAKIATYINPRGYDSPPFFSADESKIYVAHKGTLTEIDLATRDTRVIEGIPPFVALHELSFSPDGKIVVFVTQESAWGEKKRSYTVYMANSDFTNLNVVYSIKSGGRASPFKFFWSRDSADVVFMRSGWTAAYLINVNDKTPIPLQGGRSKLYDICGFSPDNTLWLLENSDTGSGINLLYRPKGASENSTYFPDFLPYCPSVWLNKSE